MSLTSLETHTSATTRLYVISGPSGVGKGTLVAAVMQALPHVSLSVSATTRLPRLGEIDGKDYHFISTEEFERLIAADALLEWAQVHGNYYGTLLAEVQNALKSGTDVILEIDPQGCEQIKQRMPQAFSVFIAPPSLEELTARLVTRATETEAEIQKRLRTAKLELATQERYNVVIINNDLEQAVSELIALINHNKSTT